MKKMAVFFVVLAVLLACQSRKSKTETKNKPKQGNWLDSPSQLPHHRQGQAISNNDSCREQIKFCSVSKKTASECAWETFNAQYFNNYINRNLDEAVEPKICSLIGGPKEEGGESKGQEDLTSKIKACKNFYYNCKESKSVELGGKATAISLGNQHSCAVLENGQVKCWGRNNLGQLGTGNETSLNIPSAAINLGEKAVSVSLGGMHSCALLENGQVKCWGRNYNGQLGMGNYTRLNIPSEAINLGGKQWLFLLDLTTAAQFLKMEMSNAGEKVTMGSLEQEIILI